MGLVKPFPFFPLLALGCLVCLLPRSAQAEDTVETINAQLKAGKKVGWIIEGSTSQDNDLAVLFTSRAKGTEESAFPALVKGDMRPGATDALGGSDNAADNRTLDNIVVSLKDKRVIGLLKTAKADDEDSDVYFPGENHCSLDAMWGPNVKGIRFGVVNYGGRWDSREVLLIETDGKSLRQSSLKTLLDAKARDFIKTALHRSKAGSADQYAIAYNLQSVVNTDAAYSASSPVTMKIGFSAEIPKGDADAIEATMTVRLETSAEKISATVLKVEKSAP
jgi:hypothetical protein